MSDILTIPEDILKAARSVLESLDIYNCVEPDEVSDAVDARIIAMAIFSERRRHQEQEASSEFERLLSK